MDEDEDDESNILLNIDREVLRFVTAACGALVLRAVVDGERVALAPPTVATISTSDSLSLSDDEESKERFPRSMVQVQDQEDRQWQ